MHIYIWVDRSELIYHMYQKLIYILFDLFFNQSHWFPTIDVNGFIINIHNGVIIYSWQGSLSPQ